MEQLDQGWSEIEFSGLSLGDRRLEKRLCKVAEQLSSNLQAPIYAATNDWCSAKAAYRLFDNQKVTPERILKPHTAQATGKIAKEELVLAIQDTTFFNFSRGKKSKNLGPIGDSTSKAQGMILHHTLAVTPNNLPLGVLTQKIWVRDGFKEQTEEERWRTSIEDKESYKWLEALRETHRLVPKSTRVVTVCDRESDVYEFLQEATLLNAEILIRASADRKLAYTKEEHFFERLQNFPIIGSIELALPQDEKRGKKVCFDIRIGSITFAPPERAGKSKLTALTFYGVLVTEQNPVNEAEKLQWKLITNVPTLTLDDAIERVLWYRCRWQIEVYHRILKTGCEVEGCLLEDKKRIERYLVLFSIIAWRIFWMTHIARVEPKAPALDILAKQELDVLKVFTKPSPSFKTELATAKDVILAIAMLGGFLNRKNDGKPGPTPIWRGWQLIQQLAMNINKSQAKKVFATYG